MHLIKSIFVAIAAALVVVADLANIVVLPLATAVVDLAYVVVADLAYIVVVADLAYIVVVALDAAVVDLAYRLGPCCRRRCRPCYRRRYWPWIHSREQIGVGACRSLEREKLLDALTGNLDLMGVGAAKEVRSERDPNAGSKKQSPLKSLPDITPRVLHLKRPRNEDSKNGLGFALRRLEAEIIDCSTSCK